MFFKLINLFLVFNFISGYQYSTSDRYYSFRDWFLKNREHQRFSIKQFIHEDNEKVDIQVYYESRCPFSIGFHTGQFNSTVAELANNLAFVTYPYGNAKTYVDENGAVTFTCQHGEAECYGNMLHACAIDILGMTTSAITYNSCLMSSSQSNGQSDDSAADECGQLFNVDSNAIKSCAKGDQGIKLMKIIGDVSKKKYPHSGVPYVVLNGTHFDHDEDLKKAVCKALKSPPRACQINILDREQILN